MKITNTKPGVFALWLHEHEVLESTFVTRMSCSEPARHRQRNFQRCSSTLWEVYWIRKINYGGKRASEEDRQVWHERNN
jgi:hypothetical protein